jgi:hypothetical protein
MTAELWLSISHMVFGQLLHPQLKPNQDKIPESYNNKPTLSVVGICHEASPLAGA